MEQIHGCLLGLFAGDAAGAVLEFLRTNITEEMAKKAMQMPGGGFWRVGAGQITDDSELALHLLYSLQGCNPAEGFPAKRVADGYRQWYELEPFDIGNTCRTAFSTRSAEEMIATARAYSMESKANGALMRVAPLAIWARNQPAATIADYARQDACLSHPSKTCQDCNAVYCVALAHLLNHPGDAAGAVAAAEQAAAQPGVEAEVKQWLADSAVVPIRLLDCGNCMGFVKHAFTLAFHFLRRATDYETAICQTLMAGGDTDTNAAIVGALIGALHGAHHIAEYMKAPVLAFDCTLPQGGKGRKRPAIYNTSAVMQMQL